MKEEGGREERNTKKKKMNKLQCTCPVQKPNPFLFPSPPALFVCLPPSAFLFFFFLLQSLLILLLYLSTHIKTLLLDSL